MHTNHSVQNHDPANFCDMFGSQSRSLS